jgi:integrase
VQISGGRYQIRKYVDGKQVFVNIEAAHPRDIAIEFNAALNDAPSSRARVAEEKKAKQGNTAILRRAVTAYYDHLRRVNRPEALEQAKQTLADLLDHGCKRTVMTKNVDADCLLSHYEWLRTEGCRRMARSGEKTGCSERTVHNKHTRIRSFLIWCKVNTSFMKGLLKRPEGKEVDAYTAADVATIRSAAVDYAPEMALVLEMGLQLGLREQELMFAVWSNVNFETRVYRVTSQPDYGFIIKGRKERSIPIPTDLFSRLKDHRAANPKGRLILANSNGNAPSHLLRTLKRLAHRAGLNCGECDACHAPEHYLDSREGKQTGCAKWTLHRMRRTWASSLLQQGFDLATVRQWAGWEDMDTPLRYLKSLSASDAATQARIDAVKFGA